MKICRNCGAEARDEARFCTKCGTPFPLEAAEPTFEGVSEPEAQPVAAPFEQPVPEAPAPAGDYAPQAWGEQPPQAQPVPPAYEYAPQAQEQQPVAAPVPPPYGYGYAQQPQQAPPAYEYVPQEQQPIAAPPQPSYDYGYAQQPQQAPPAYEYVPQEQQPTYGYAQQPESPQAAPSYGYPAQEPAAPKPKKKRRWLIPVIALVVVAALLLGTFLIFGDQIKGLFSSPEKKWLNAEKALIAGDKDSLLGSLQGSFTKQLDRKKFGSETSIEIDVKTDQPDAAAIFDIVKKLRLTLGSMVSTEKDDFRFHAKVGLGNRDKDDDAITLQIYNVDGNIVINAAPIIEDPLVIRGEALEELMDLDDNFSDLFKDGLADFMNMANSFTELQASTEKMSNDLLDIVAKHAEKPEVEKGEELSLEGISQKFTKYTVVIKAEKTREMVKDMLAYIRDSKEIRKAVEELGKFMEKMDTTGSNSFDYDDFVDSMNEAIKELDDHGDDFLIEFRRELYLDNKGKPQAGTLTIYQGEDKDKVFTLSHTHVESNGKHAFEFIAQPEDETGMFFRSEYTLKNSRYSGSFELGTSNDDEEKVVLDGTVDNFGFEEADGQVYPVGELSFKPKAPEPGAYSSIPQEMSFTFEGEVEKKSDGPHWLATFAVDIEDNYTGPIKVNLSIDHRNLPEKDITFESKMPTDYIDVLDEDNLEELFTNDPGVLMRLMAALSELGIDISQFMGGFDY